MPCFPFLTQLPIKNVVAFYLLSLLFSSASASAKLSASYCLNQNLFLLVNFACCSAGSGDLVSLIGQHEELLYVDAYVNSNGDPDYAPWSYNPVCTEVLSEIGSELCVYTDVSFGGGRGISIFTTPQIAKEFVTLLPFRDRDALDGINSLQGPWHLQDLPGKGIGTLANHALARGDRIMAYNPVLLAHMEKVLSTPVREKFLRIAVDQLPTTSRELYLSLATIYGIPDVIIQDVAKANAFEMQIGGQMHLAILPETSRINHDCAPNSQYYLNPALLTHYVHTTRQVARNEEITISYLNPFQPYASRQQYLRDAFYFNCSCSRCMAGDTVDEVLDQITSLQQILGDWSTTSTATVKEAEKLIQIYKDSGLDGFLDSAYGYAALAYNAIGDAAGAIRYANLAAEAVVLKDGPGAADYQMWNEMVNNPEGHWSWKWRNNGGVDRPMNK